MADMTQEQIEMLRKALDLYEFSISQREFPHEEENEFFHLRETLTDILGINLYKEY